MAKNINALSPTTTAADGSLVYVGVPGGINPDPFQDRKITKVNFFLPLQTQITTNAADIDTNELAIAALQALTFRVQFVNQVAATFEYVQPANSVINYFNLRSALGGTFIISGSVSGVIQTVTTLASGVLYRVDKIVDSVPGQTITFTITGTVSSEIYLNLNTI